MKTVFIEARARQEFVLPKRLVKKLPKAVALFTTVQYIKSLDRIKQQLEENDKKIILIKPEHAHYPGQLLGCNADEFSQEFNAFLYIGDGMFHPQALALKNNQPVFVYNPLSKKHFVLDSGDVKEMKKKQEAALAGFISCKQIGVLVSTKPGQQKLKKAYELEKHFPDKNFYFLVFDTIDFSELENFPFIECFVSTACPRIAFDEAEKIKKPVVNIDELEKAANLNN